MGDNHANLNLSKNKIKDSQVERDIVCLGLSLTGKA